VETGIDVALQLGELKDSRVVARRVRNARHVACAAPALLAEHGEPAHPKDLASMNCLGFYSPTTGRVLEWRFRKGNETWKHLPGGNLLFNSSEALIDVAVRGGGVIYMLDVLIKHAVAAGKLKPLLTEWDTLERPIFLVHPHKKHVPAKVRAFAEFVEQLFARLD
jgi:LysR family transcriptional regulator for bpeEF and oprC